VSNLNICQKSRPGISVPIAVPQLRVGWENALNVVRVPYGQDVCLNSAAIAPDISLRQTGRKGKGKP